MTRRGKATLAGLAGVAALLGGSALGLVRGPAAPPQGGAGAAPGSQGSAPGAPALPEAIFERLPVTREILSLPTDRPAGAGALETGSGPGKAPRAARGHFYELVPLSHPGLQGPLRVEYTFDAELTERVFDLLSRGRVKLGHVVLLDAHSGRVLAYASTDLERFPPTRAYPSASLVKVITAAAALERDWEKASLPCRYRGNPYRLGRAQLDPPRAGRTVSLRGALATSNNQCFAQLAVHAVGAEALVNAIERFGWLSPPARAHEAGQVGLGEERLELGRLGCGLAGCSITPLHAVQLAATLARGERVAPRWIERVLDADGRELPLPAVASPRRVISPELADELRGMLVDTTVKGTARSAFRRSNGRPLLGPLQVAGKTGSLSGTDPKGRYEWFIGVAPADAPRIAIAVLLVQGERWWRTASQIAGDVLRVVYCPEGPCSAEAAARWIPGPAARSLPPPSPPSSS